MVPGNKNNRTNTKTVRAELSRVNKLCKELNNRKTNHHNENIHLKKVNNNFFHLLLLAIKTLPDEHHTHQSLGRE